MRILPGTSGFSYKAWKGSFYPEDLPDSEMLRYYSSRLPAVEINNTFYRMPRAPLLESWAEQVPDGFAFALKATQQITHRRRLKDAQESVSFFLQLATPNESTAGWGYLRLRRPDYSGADLAACAERIRTQTWSEAYVFFKHEEAGTGPRLAGELRELLA